MCPFALAASATSTPTEHEARGYVRKVRASHVRQMCGIVKKIVQTKATMSLCNNWGHDLLQPTEIWEKQQDFYASEKAILRLRHCLRYLTIAVPIINGI